MNNHTGGITDMQTYMVYEFSASRSKHLKQRLRYGRPCSHVFFYIFPSACYESLSSLPLHCFQSHWYYASSETPFPFPLPHNFPIWPNPTWSFLCWTLPLPRLFPILNTNSGITSLPGRAHALSHLHRIIRLRRDRRSGPAPMDVRVPFLRHVGLGVSQRQKSRTQSTKLFNIYSASIYCSVSTDHSCNG